MVRRATSHRRSYRAYSSSLGNAGMTTITSATCNECQPSSALSTGWHLLLVAALSGQSRFSKTVPSRLSVSCSSLRMRHDTKIALLLSCYRYYRRPGTGCKLASSRGLKGLRQANHCQERRRSVVIASSSRHSDRVL